MKDLIINNIGSITNVIITILGFIITYFMTQKNFKDELRKNKIALTSQEIMSLPYDICQLMDAIIKDKSKTQNAKSENQDEFLKAYGAILSKVLAYGSESTVKIAIKLQQLSYTLSDESDKTERLSVLALYALLITQLKYDLTSEIISPESWFHLMIKDYNETQPQMKKNINDIVNELGLLKSFRV